MYRTSGVLFLSRKAVRDAKMAPRRPGRPGGAAVKWPGEWAI